MASAESSQEEVAGIAAEAEILSSERQDDIAGQPAGELDSLVLDDEQLGLSKPTPPIKLEEGAVASGKDIQQLYFYYLTNKIEDFQYVLETRGLGAHCENFHGFEALDGHHYPEIRVSGLNLQTPEMKPEVIELQGIFAHLTFPEFEEELKRALPTWIQHRNFQPTARQDIQLVGMMGMVSDLLSASAFPAAADRFLSASASSATHTAVYASTDKGYVHSTAARSVVRMDGSVFRIEPTKLAYRVLDIFNGPVFVGQIEERSGFVRLVQDTNSVFESRKQSELVPSSFVMGNLHDSYSYRAVMDCIQSVSSFSSLLQKLLSIEFDVAPHSEDHKTRRSNGRCWRIQHGKLVVGALWDYRGQCGCLRWQPSATDFGQSWGTVCVYRDDTSEVFIQCWNLFQRCNSVSEMRQALQRHGLTTHPVLYSAQTVL